MFPECKGGREYAGQLKAGVNSKFPSGITSLIGVFFQEEQSEGFVCISNGLIKVLGWISPIISIAL
jgi:hypothetical protein